MKRDLALTHIKEAQQKAQAQICKEGNSAEEAVNRIVLMREKDAGESTTA